MAKRTGTKDYIARDWGFRFLWVMSMCGFITISFIPEVIASESRAVTVPFRAVVLGVSCYKLMALPFTRVGYKIGRWGVFLLLFMFGYAIRIIHDVLSPFTVLGRPREEYLLYGFGVSMVPALALMRKLKEPDRTWISSTIYWGYFAVSVAAYIFESGSESASLRQTGNSVLNAITFGHVGVSLFLLSLLRLISQEAPWRRVISVAGISIGLLTAVLSGSRGPIVALIICSVTLVSSVPKTQRLVGTVFAIAVLFGLALVGIGSDIYGNELDYLLARFERTADGVGTEATRLELYQEAIEAFLAHPGLGYGLELPTTGYPHNILIEAFMSTGLAGGVVFSVLCAEAGRRAWKMLAAGGQEEWVGILLVQSIIGAQFSGSLYGNAQLWCLFAYALLPERTSSTDGHPPSRGGVERVGRHGEGAPSSLLP